MKFKIGDMARILGIPTHVIRFYEKHKIVMPVVDEQSGYRYYEEFDICRLLNSKLYRSMGFSIKETAKMSNNCSRTQLREMMKHRLMNVEQEIESLQKLRKRLNQHIEKTTDIEYYLEHCCLLTLPDTYWLYSHNNSFKFEQLHENEEITKYLMERLPHVRFICAVPQQSIFYSGPFIYNWGLAIDDEQFQTLENDVKKQFVHYPGGRYVYSVIENDKDCIITRGHFEKAIGYIDENGLEIAGTSLIELVEVAYENNEVVSKLSLHIPVK